MTKNYLTYLYRILSYSKLIFSLVLLNLLFTYNLNAQSLSPHFNKEELIDMLKITGNIKGTLLTSDIKPPKTYSKVYESKEVGLANLWELWYNKERDVSVIAIRGSVGAKESWLSNFYAAMVPAQGQLQLSPDENFKYNLADSKDATVHVGWLVSTAYLIKDMLPQIDSMYQMGHKDFIVSGHSQGGALSVLITAHLYQLQKESKLPHDIRFKTYTMASPKPGNMYFAYNYENITRDWAFHAINTQDWVPEVPLSVQTLDNFNEINIFTSLDQMIKKQSFFKRIFGRILYNRIKNPPIKSQKRYEKYLGKIMFKQIKKYLPQLVEPIYASDSNYMRCGHSIILQGDKEYDNKFTDPKNTMSHHRHQAYIYLAEKLVE